MPKSNHLQLSESFLQCFIDKYAEELLEYLEKDREKRKQEPEKKGA